ncbi:MAG: hypothetical protein CMJ89_02270 [Planctomycetes bacterium]|nr:hypothetical protein [Planctomycetota bacterium]
MSSILAHLSRVLPAAIAGAFIASGCDGNVACVFSPQGCGAGSDAPLGGNPAGTPFTGMKIVDLPPVIESLFPGQGNHPGSTPIVIIFSESMQVASLQSAFELVTLAGGVIGPGFPLTGQLLAEGRVFVAFAPEELEINDYQVRPTGMPVPMDMTGQEAQLGLDPVINFTVSADAPIDPQLVANFPGDVASTTGASETGDIVVVFDRPVDESSVDANSFVVDDNGTILTMPVITPLTVGVPPAVVTDTRVFIMRAPGLDVGGSVSVTLSPASARIVDTTPQANALIEQFFEFTVTDLATPVSGLVLSDPSNAVGSANLTPGGANEFEIDVALTGAQVNDFIDVFVFGENADLTRRIAVRGSFTIDALLPDPANPTILRTEPFGLAAVPLVVAADPRFADGLLDIGFRLGRPGGQRSALRLLDVTPATPLVDDSILQDTTGPVVLELLLSGGSLTTARSDARDLAIAGRASERIRAVEVLAGGMSNELTVGEPAPVAGTAGGLFLTAPVPLGVIDGGSTLFTLTAFDEALNPSAPLTGTFEQLGAVRPGGRGGSMLEIEVFDVGTLVRLPGATVLVNSDAGDGVNFPPFSSGMTDGNGSVALPFDPGAAAVIVTVDLAGYDLFTVHGLTLHGLMDTALSVPLLAMGNSLATSSGVVSSLDPNVVLLLPLLDGKLSDTRFPSDLNRSISTDLCGIGVPLSCPFGPSLIRAGAIGAQAFLAGDLSLSGMETNFAERLIEAFDVSLPLDIAEPGQTIINQIEIETLLRETAPAQEEAPVALQDLDFDASSVSRVDLDNLDDDPLTTGAPRVAGETVVSGLTGPLVVGSGISIDLGGGMWMVRSAYPGILNRSGFLGRDATAEERLRLRFEVRDVNGNASGRRPLISTLPAAPVPPIVLQNVPQLVAPTTNTGPLPFTLELTNETPVESEGFYRVELDDGVRGWVLWRSVTSGTGNVLVRVVQPGGTPLNAGALTVDIATFYTENAALDSFLWTDLENLNDSYTRAETQSLESP